MRGGNFSFRLNVPEAFVVHRGVSQGGKKLTVEGRKAFWLKFCQKVSGVEIDGTSAVISLAGLKVLREKHLVLVSNSAHPRVWTVRRIMESAERIGAMQTQSVALGASRRRGGLKLGGGL